MYIQTCHFCVRYLPSTIHKTTVEGEQWTVADSESEDDNEDTA